MLLCFGAVPLCFKVFHQAPFVIHDWGFFVAVALGAYLIDAPDVSAAIDKAKSLWPGQRDA